MPPSALVASSEGAFFGCQGLTTLRRDVGPPRESEGKCASRPEREPLHVSFADERGGNEIEITGHLCRGRLHAVWDSASLSRASATICPGRSNTRQIVVLGEPEPLVAPRLGVTGAVKGIAQGLGRVRLRRSARGQGWAAGSRRPLQRRLRSPVTVSPASAASCGRPSCGGRRQ